MQRQSTLAGRRTELRRVCDALTGAADVDVLLILADAGVGKSKLVSAATAAAHDAQTGGHPTVIVRGECLRLTEQMPLLPIITALRAAYAHNEGQWARDAIASCPDYVGAALSTLLPELHHSQETPVAGADSDPWWRQRLFNAIGSAFSALRRSQPCALVIEDLHWADTSTLDLLDYLLRPTTETDFVPVVLTARLDDPDTAAVNRDWLSSLRNRHDVDVLRLRPLPLEETAEQIELLLHHPPDPDYVAHIFDRSEGNALFTEQLVSQDDREPAPRLPHDLQALFEMKLAQLGPPAEQVAQALAIIGRPVSTDVISLVTGLSTSNVRSALRELHGQRLLRPGDGESHALRHALLADAVSERMLSSDRVAGHRRAAELLAKADAGAAEIAEHWQQAHEPTQELRWRVRAADDAAATYAPAQAAAHAARVLDLWDEVEEPEVIAGRPHGQALMFTVSQFSSAGLPRDAATLLESALAESWTATEPGLRAQLLTHAAFYRGSENAAEGLRTSTEAVTLFEELPPTAAKLFALAQHGRLLVEQGQLTDAETVISRALAISADLPAKPMHRVLLIHQAWFAMARGDATRALHLLDQAWKPEFDTIDPWVNLWATAAHTDLLIELGRFEDVAPAADKALTTVQGLNLPEENVSAVVRGTAVVALIALGRPEEAGRYLEPLAGPSVVGQMMIQPLLAELDMLAGDLDAAAQRFASLGERTDASIEERLEASAPQAELELWLGHPDAALRRLLAVLTSAAPTDLARFAGWPLTTAARCAADLSEALLGEQRRETARTLLADLSAVRTSMQSDPLAHAAVPATSRPCAATWRAETGRLLGTSNPTDWSEAADSWLDLKVVHRAAYCRWRQAEALLTTRNHRDQARAVLRTADNLARGHQPLTAAISATAERARITLADTTPPDRPQHTKAPALLTERELAVLRLLAEGKTNNAIGQALFISPKTASVHVTNILRKLDVQSRVQAATIAQRSGLLSDK